LSFTPANALPIAPGTPDATGVITAVAIAGLGHFDFQQLYRRTIGSWQNSVKPAVKVQPASANMKKMEILG
jgi:hypothetical protein